MLPFAWIILAVLTAFYGYDRFTGFWGTLFLALILSPPLILVFLILLDKYRPLPMDA